MSGRALAEHVWESECFGLELYSIEGKRVTQAEAYASWAQQGYTRLACQQWWARAPYAPLSDELPREVNQAWKRARMEESRSARSEGPQAASAPPRRLWLDRQR